MGTRGRDLVKLTPTSLGLTAWGTSHLNVHGAVNSMTPVHKPWHDGKPQHCPEMEDWQKRPGYGKTPKYLQRQRTVFMDSALSQEPPPSPPADASMNGGMNSARTLASSRGSLSPFEKSSLAYSEGTIRLIEHPVKWQRTVQQNMSSTFQPDSLSRNTSAMCCTYGLHPAFRGAREPCLRKQTSCRCPNELEIILPRTPTTCGRVSSKRELSVPQ